MYRVGDAVFRDELQLIPDRLQVSAGASTQVGTGFVMEGPLEHLGLVPKLTNDYATGRFG